MKERRLPENSVIYQNIATAIRLILGAEFFINGLNWWVKLVDPYPSMSDFIHHEPPNSVVGALIKSGILFHLVKAVELSAGIAFLLNRFVPLALVASFPVTVIVFIVDVFMSPHLRSHINGSGALMMSIFLMFSYIRYYLPMLDFVTPLRESLTTDYTKIGLQLKWLDPQASKIGPVLMVVGGAVSLILGLIMIVWLLVLVGQHFTHV